MEMLYVSEGMVGFYVILGLFLLILDIAMIVKFFNIAADVREMKEAGNHFGSIDTSELYHSVKKIESKVSNLDGLQEVPDISLAKRSGKIDTIKSFISQIEILCSIGEKETAKKLLLLYINRSVRYYAEVEGIKNNGVILDKLRFDIGYAADLVGITLSLSAD